MEITSIRKKILLLREKPIMLDVDLASLYGTETRILKQAVKRNKSRFPADFMFVLTQKEVEHLRSQNVISSAAWGGTRYKPYAFTEQGVAMLSSILNTPKAIRVNITIVRAFVLLRKYALSHEELARKVEALEIKFNTRFRDIDAALSFLITKKMQESKPRKRIGFSSGSTL